MVQGQYLRLGESLNMQGFCLGISPGLKLSQIHPYGSFGLYSYQRFLSQGTDIEFVIILVGINLCKISFYRNQFSNILNLVENNITLLDNMSVLKIFDPGYSPDDSSGNQNQQNDYEEITNIFHLKLKFITPQ